MMKVYQLLSISAICLGIISCQTAEKEEKEVKGSKKIAITYSFEEAVTADTEFNITFPYSGRYQINVYGKAADTTKIWIEDYIENLDDRVYDLSSYMKMEDGVASTVGSPLAKAEHSMRIHLEGEAAIDSIQFELLLPHLETPNQLTQSMNGENWKLVWSDEFEGQDVDTTKWSFNVGNWGWGNHELQYYTPLEGGNAFVQDGNLHIQARKDEEGNWTSARLTTQAKYAFTYGKVEFRAKVPANRGLWAAGWMLGDSYQDELSWPYCGEIDILECVGYEINDTTGNGVNHGTCHTRKYYFKQGNQIGSKIDVENMNQEFHTYSIEWDSLEITAYVDENHYFTYDKNQDELEWPFHKSHNIILNLAVGGGWGGLKGIDPSFDSADYIIDYVRVYGKE